VTGCIVGLALGQLFTGMVPDRLGRRRPLMVGMGVWVVATVMCALAPSIWLVTGLRVVQGLGAGIAIALARTVIADLDPDRLAEHLSRMMLVLSVVPVLAPAFGGAALALTSWRGLFVIVAVVGLMLLSVVVRYLPESRPRSDVRVKGGGLGRTLHLARSRAFLLPALVSGTGFGVMFSYIGDSAFVFRDHFGMNPTVYGFMFGANACAMISGFQIGPILKRRWGTRRVLITATVFGMVGGLLMILAGLIAPDSVLPVVLSLMLVLAAAGILVPLATAAAIDAHPDHVGAASGLSGALQFMMGGALGVLPAVLPLGAGALPLAVVCTTCLAAAWLFVLKLKFMDSGDNAVAPVVLSTAA
jgi:DHA1 family bicyclomycin/chloramphenicol resistance-like MFS transporter